MSKSIRKQQVLPAQQSAALGVRQLFDIPLTADLERIIINLTGSVTLSTGASALVKDGISEIIQSVDLIANGAITIASIPFHQLVNGNLFRRHAKGPAGLVTQPGLTAAAQAFQAIGVLDLSAFGALRPKDSSLRETNYKTLQLGLRYAGDWTGVFTGGGFVVSSTTLNMEVCTEETVEMQGQDGKISSPILVPQFAYREDTVTGAVTRQRLRLTPDQALRGITLRCVGSTGLVTSDTTLSRVRVYTGTTLRYELTASALRARNLAEMEAAPPTGYYYMNLAGQGATPDRLSDSYDLRTAILNGADSYLEYDTAAAQTLGITQWGYVGTNPNWLKGQ